MSLPTSLGLFVLAGLCEIGGGYLMWLAIRGNRHWMYAAIGAVVLTLGASMLRTVECSSSCPYYGGGVSTEFGRIAMTR
jgi:drug/metabolite transporter superfamily protein YnfA